MDSIAKIAFGIDFDSLHNPKAEFSVAFDQIQELIVERLRVPFLVFRLKKMFGIGSEATLKRHSDKLNDLVQLIIRERQKVATNMILFYFFR